MAGEAYSQRLSRSKEEPDLLRPMTSPSSAPTPAPSDPARPTIFKLGVGLLVIHELIVIGLCSFGGVIGAFGILFGSLQSPDSDDIGLMVLFGSLVAFLLMLGVGIACCSLVVCFLAWSGSRVWLQALIVIALINCVVVVPNPLGILAAVLCVLGSLQYLESTAGEPEVATEPTTESEPED